MHQLPTDAPAEEQKPTAAKQYQMPTADQQIFDYSHSQLPSSTISMPKELYNVEPVIDQASKIELYKPCHGQ